MILQPQCSQTGANLWIAPSKLSKTCLAPAATTSNAMSYLFPQTSQVPVGLPLLRVGSFRASVARPEQPDTHVTNAARPRRRPPPDVRAPPRARRIPVYHM